MKSIALDSLKAGMIFDKPVYVEGNNILVPPGVPIKQKDLERLKNWDIVEVFSEGKVVASAEEGSTSATGKGREEFSFYTRAVQKLDTVFENLRQNHISGQDKAALDAVSVDIFQHCTADNHQLVQKILVTSREEKNLVVNSLNGTILATIIGRVVIQQKAHLLDLIAAALLHDTGMMQIPESIIKKQDRLTSMDIQEIHTHTQHSYAMIKKLGYPERVARIALLHHERWNGSGYPEGLKGNTIPLEARVLAVADTYVALVNSRPYREYLIGYSAMKTILSDNGTHFDPGIIKVFLQSIGIYPIGSIVKLSDQSIGKITDINSKAPLRPRLRLLQDRRGERVQVPVEIDLMEQHDLFITKALDPKTLAGTEYE